MPVRTRRTRSSQRLTVLRDTTNVRRMQNSSTSHEKLAKERALETFLKDFDSQAAAREKKMEKCIADFCKSIHSKYNILIQQIPKKYQNMKLEDYMAGGGILGSSVDDDINRMLLDIIPVNSAIKRTKKKKMNSVSKRMKKENENDDGEYVPPQSSKLKRRSQKSDYPHVEKLYTSKPRKVEDDSTSVRRVMLRPSTMRKNPGNPNLSDSIQKSFRQISENGTRSRCALNSTSRSKEPHSSSTKKSSSKPSTSSTRSTKNRTDSRGAANKKNSRTAKSHRKASVASRSKTPLTPIASSPMTLICPLQNGESLTIGLDTNLENLPLNSNLIDNLIALKRKLSIFLCSTPY